MWHNLEFALADFLFPWANFHCCIWPNIEEQSGHLVTLVSIKHL